MAATDPEMSVETDHACRSTAAHNSYDQYQIIPSIVGDNYGDCGSYLVECYAAVRCILRIIERREKAHATSDGNERCGPDEDEEVDETLTQSQGSTGHCKGDIRL